MDKLIAAQVLGVAEYTITGIQFDAEADGWAVTVRDMSTHTEAARLIPHESVAHLYARPGEETPVEDEQDEPSHGEALADMAVEMADLAKTMAKSVPEVIAWVGDDPKRATDALAVERLRERPRKTLVDALRAQLDAAKAAADQ